MDTKIRRPYPGEEQEIAKVHIQSWQEAYKGIMPQDYLDHHVMKIEKDSLN